MFFTASADGVNYQTVKMGAYLKERKNFKLTKIITLPVPRLHLLLPLILNPKKWLDFYPNGARMCLECPPLMILDELIQLANLKSKDLGSSLLTLTSPVFTPNSFNGKSNTSGRLIFLILKTLRGVVFMQSDL